MSITKTTKLINLIKSPFILKRKWIQMEICLMVNPDKLLSLKELLQPYIFMLNWQVKEDKVRYTEKGIVQKTSFVITPKSGDISPLEYLNKKKEILGLTFAIHRDLVYEEDNVEAKKNYIKFTEIAFLRQEGAIKDINDYFFRTSLGPLVYSYKLRDRIILDKTYPEIALEIFGKSAKEELDFLFRGKEENDMKNEIQYLFKLW